MYENVAVEWDEDFSELFDSLSRLGLISAGDQLLWHLPDTAESLRFHLESQSRMTAMDDIREDAFAALLACISAVATHLDVRATVRFEDPNLDSIFRTSDCYYSQVIIVESECVTLRETRQEDSPYEIDDSPTSTFAHALDTLTEA